jgi:hypothetical protein
LGHCHFYPVENDFTTFRGDCRRPEPVAEAFSSFASHTEGAVLGEILSGDKDRIGRLASPLHGCVDDLPYIESVNLLQNSARRLIFGALLRELSFNALPS